MKRLHKFVEYGRRGPSEILQGVYRRTRRWTTFARAAARRTRLPGVTFVGITGSAGKTTTKDLAGQILATAGPCATTPASENEHLYVAQTILRAERLHRFCVVEVSASAPGYLDLSLRLLRPQIGVLTTIGSDHFKSFRSVEAIAREKGKLIASLPREGTAVLNRDDPLVRTIGERASCHVIWVGESSDADIRLCEASSNWPEPLKLAIEHKGERHEISTHLHGTHLALPVLSALGIALAAGIPLPAAISALSRAAPSEGRMEVVHGSDGVTFVRDDWKAPHWSVKAPLQFLRDAKAARRVVVFGTISDMTGDASGKYKGLARDTRAWADLVVFVGPNALRAVSRHAGDESVRGFPEIRGAAAYLRDALKAGDLVLLKGSNKADHLVRLVLDRERPVQCWETRCGFPRFCGSCSMLYSPLAQSPTQGGATKSAPFDASEAPSPTARPGTGSWIVVGLGNPGDQYLHTPHNAGYRVLDAISASHGGTWEEMPEGLVCNIRFEDGLAVTLLKPASKMNHCGLPIRQFLIRAGGTPARCIIVHDDTDLEIGTVRRKADGGDAGHKGMRSIISALGTGAITRIRIGVRRPGDSARARQRVLGRFSADDEILFMPALGRAIEAIRAETRGVRDSASGGKGLPELGSTA